MEIIRYQPTLKKTWDSFVSHSRNGTFLFMRDYMDYHQDRFQDFSLIFYDEKQKLRAVLPAHRKDDQLMSHQGLSYGGWVTQDDMTQPLMLSIFQQLILFLLEQKISAVHYKTIPRIYHQAPSDEDLYALFLINAQLSRRDALTVIDQRHPLEFQGRRLRILKKAKTFNLSITQENNFTEFWQVLTQNLQERHESIPVHSLEEIQNLAEKFPTQIRLFTCRNQQDLLAGVVVYETQMVAHFQYIASSVKGREVGAVDFLFSYLIKETYFQMPFIDFGNSNINNGKQVNIGLVDFKIGFGGRTVAQDYYSFSLSEDLVHLIEQAIT